MTSIKIFSKAYCPYCDYAKQLLDKKEVQYTEIRADLDQDAYQWMLTHSEGRRTFPQIFIEDLPIGGYDDLNAMNQSGELDRILNTNKEERK